MFCGLSKMTDEQLGFWDEEGGLVLWPPDLLADADLPEDAKKYLSQVGLPCESEPVRFELTFMEMQLLVSHPGYLVIGYVEDFPICLKWGTGQVFCFEEVKKAIFVNTNLRRFAACTRLYERYRLESRDLDDEAAKLVVAKTEQAMRDVDPSALLDENSWWSVIIEQMYNGFL